MTDEQNSEAAPVLRLEPIAPTHAGELFGGLSDPELYRFVAESPPASVAALRSRYEKLATRRSPDGSETWLNWAIWSREERAYLGYVQATVGRRGVAEVAYVLFRAYWRRGYARAAVAQMIALVEKEHHVTTFWANVDSRNVASRALLTALGFDCVGIRRDAEWIDGQPSDEAVYVLEVATSTESD